MSNPPPRPRRARGLHVGALAGLCGALLAASIAARAGPACRAESGARVPTVVELYTSEGCSSCPPAERWLSGLKGRDGVIPLAFHVDYWDSLGWKDRFAQPQFTLRQNASQRTSGARFAYTPQVLLDGRDMPHWSALSPAALQAGAPATVGLALEQQGPILQLVVTPAAGAPARVGGYLAVVDDGMQTQVGAGENRGATLRQDDVVRELLPWNATSAGVQTLRFTPLSTPEAGASRHWVAVAVDAASGRPLQALSLACAR